MSLEFTWISPQNLNWKYLFIDFHTQYVLQSKRPKESCHFPEYAASPPHPPTDWFSFIK